MRRGDIVTVAFPGDFGKPRPALVVQSDLFEASATMTVLLITPTLVDAPLFRIALAPDAANGLRLPSQVTVDKAMTVRRERVAGPIGRIDADSLVAVERSLAIFLGLG